MSNHQKLLEIFFKIAEYPSEFYKSLNYKEKRVFQNIMFLEGFKFSLKNKECRTSKFNMTNASAESFNAKIKAFRAQFRGLRNVDFFLFRLSNIFA